MPQTLSEEDDFSEFITRVASRYHLEGKTQSEVSKEFGISRQKVQRLLRKAREIGIVEMKIRPLTSISLDLEGRLKTHFKLKDVIVAASQPSEEERRHSVARAAASYLERHLSDGVVVAVGMGRNTGELPDFYHPHNKIDCTFISAMGGAPHVGESINPNDICQRLAKNSKGRSMHLYAPAFVESVEVRDILFAQEAVGPILAQAKQADIAIVGIGTPSDDATLVRMDCLSVSEALRLAVNGAVGDLLGDYFKEDGQMIASELKRRLVGLSLHDLRHIPTVIAVVSEKGKCKAILGALRTGIIHILITESENAKKVLQMIN